MKNKYRISVRVALATMFVLVFFTAEYKPSLNDMKNSVYTSFISKIIIHFPSIVRFSDFCNPAESEDNYHSDNFELFFEKLIKGSRCYNFISTPTNIDNNVLETYFRAEPTNTTIFAIEKSDISKTAAIITIICCITGILTSHIKLYFKSRKKLFKIMLSISTASVLSFVLLYISLMFFIVKESINTVTFDKWEKEFYFNNIPDAVATAVDRLNTNELIFKTNLEDKNKTVTITPYDTSNNQQRIVVSYNKKDKKLKWVKEEVKSDGKIELIKTWKEKAY